MNGKAADVDGTADGDDVAIAVGANDAVGEAGKIQGFDLINVAGGAARDQAGGAERFVGTAHHFAECRRGDRAIEVLEDDDRRPGEFREVRELVAEAGVNVAGPRGKSRAEGRGG